MNFLEQLFETVFVFVVFLDLDFNLLVSALTFWFVCIEFLLNFVTGNFSISCGNDYWNEWLYIFPNSFCLNFRISEPFGRLRSGDDSFLFDNDGLLDKDLFVIFGFNLPGDFYLFVRGGMADILLNKLLLKFGLDGTGLGLERWHLQRWSLISFNNSIYILFENLFENMFKNWWIWCFRSIKFIKDHIEMNWNHEMSLVRLILSTYAYTYFLNQFKLFQAAQMSLRINLPVVLYFSNH